MESTIHTSTITAAEEAKTRQNDLNALKHAADTHNLKLFWNVSYDGNCLFASILKIKPGCAFDETELRKNLVDFFSNEQVIYTVIGLLKGLCILYSGLRLIWNLMFTVLNEN